MCAGVEDAEPGHNVESGLTHLSAHVTVNLLGGHGLSGRAVVSMPHAIARFCSAAMAVIYLKSMSSFQRSFGRAWGHHEGGSEEGPAVCCSTGTWAGGGRDWVGYCHHSMP